MKARTVAIRPALGAVVAAEVVAITAYAALPPARFTWWPFALITAVALVLLLVTVHRRNFAVWVAARVRWWRTRRYATPVGAAIDIGHGSDVYGVRTAGDEAVTVIRVDGRPYEPTFLRGSSIARTTNLLPLDIVTQFLDQPGGLRLGIDIASLGFRVRPGTGYPALYGTLLADRGAAGQRTTYLVVRLEISQSLPGLVYRQSIGTAAAAATDRIVKALEQEGVRAVALNAEDQDAVMDKLSLGLAAAPTRPVVLDPLDVDDDHEDDRPAPGADIAADSGRHRRSKDNKAAEPQERPQKIPAAVEVGWSLINTEPGYVTSYYFSPEDITTATVNQMWALPSDDIVHVLMLRKRGDTVMVSAMVRTNDPRPPEQPPTLFLNPLPGAQYAAALRAAPVSAPHLPLPEGPLPEDLEIAVGATGVLVGAALVDDKNGSPEIRRDDLVMLALTDPQRPTRISMDTSEFYVRQQLIRAAAAGERIAIYSADPSRWYSVSQPNIAVAEPGRRVEFVPTIIVNDHAPVAPPVGLSSTVITLGRVTDSAPDIVFQQNSPTTVRIRAGGRQLDVSIVEFRQEQTWTGAAA
ncbi:type VII secretion protein EccE [Mycobacterium avium]|uniref:type VII secretion protein EccE n=1 Tax=Mycobacterium avium TaxID=1764 RepID=UPI0009FED788|nr:type VII secretion protein EccE [Mycobacterium avium]PBA42271.1 type VII secretion protein EccE [Mycobacterium avium]PBA86017.1 type VII secretion protein EccE [Mycobacterium avium]